MAIERGRHQNVERRLRKCIYCDVNEIEDEFHFVIVCPKYTYLRNKYINKYYTNRLSMLKFVQLLNSTNVKTLNNLAIFCIKAFVGCETHCIYGRVTLCKHNLLYFVNQ